MAIVKPFPCVRPDQKLASLVAALPYDVYNAREAKEEALKNPRSFLNIDRPETQFPDGVNPYGDQVYQKARELFKARMADGTFVESRKPAYYIYELTMDGRRQTGLTACSAIDDYESGVIRRHENTREEKEADRIRHVTALNAQTGPIFLAYRSDAAINGMVDAKVMEEPLYDFAAEDGIRHRVWEISDNVTVEAISQAFAQIPATYIADGHHRAASAVKVGLRMRREQPGYTGEEPFNYFLSVLFPDDQLMILPYNRAVRDLNGLTRNEFLKKLNEAGFQVETRSREAVALPEKGSFGMYLEGSWYCLKTGEGMGSCDPVKGLDVSILQDYLLGPILGISDPRVDKRIDFIGGIRGAKELERRCGEDMAAAFSMHPTSVEELFRVADAGLLMPPKSTWFEPKLRSGLFIHTL